VRRSAASNPHGRAMPLPARLRVSARDRSQGVFPLTPDPSLPRFTGARGGFCVFGALFRGVQIRSWFLVPGSWFLVPRAAVLSHGVVLRVPRDSEADRLFQAASVCSKRRGV